MDKTTVADYDGVVKALEYYIEGAKSGISAAMKPGFHGAATMTGYFQGVGLLEGSIQNLYDFIDASGPAKELKARIDVLDIAGTIATARLTIEDWNGASFTDHHQLLKVDGAWKVVSKVFHQHG